MANVYEFSGKQSILLFVFNIFCIESAYAVVYLNLKYAKYLVNPKILDIAPQVTRTKPAFTKLNASSIQHKSKGALEAFLRVATIFFSKEGKHL